MKKLLSIALITLLLSTQSFADSTTHCEPDGFGGYDCTTTED